MKCNKCGNEIEENAKFCKECGSKVERNTESHTIQLRCKACGGVMQSDLDSPILYCQFCGSKELLNESSEVTVERIRSKAYKDIEMEKLEYRRSLDSRKETQEEKQKSENEVNSFKKSKFSKILLIFCVICAIATFISFSNGKILPGVISAVQTGLFAVAWLSGMKFVLRDKKNFHFLLAVIGFAFVLLFILASNRSSDSSETFVWPSSGLNTIIPEPKSNKGNIYDSTESFSVNVRNTTENEFQDYIAACEKAGFTIEAERDSTSYNAFNKDGYHISIYYYKSNKTMDIDLDAPKASGTLKWPSSPIADLLPIPSSNIGEITHETDHGFSAYVGGVSQNDYNEYVDACIDNGFDVDYSRGDRYYYADNSEGYHLSLNYEGFNTMSIDIDAPDETEDISIEEDTSIAEPDATTEPIEKALTTQPESTTPTVAPSTSTGIRPEFKAAMDSYEEFFDEYIEFMKSFDSDNVTMMIEYASFMAQYAETMEKMDEMGEEEMNDAELAYYIEVTTRINQKLMSVEY